MLAGDEQLGCHDLESAVQITGFFTTSPPGAQRLLGRDVTYLPPPWLLQPALNVLHDLQASEAIAGLQITAYPIDELSGLTLGLAEPHRVRGELVQLADDLDPDLPTTYGGGNWVPRSLAGPGLLVLIADLLQEDLAETSVAWGQARPPCSGHRHPARPEVRDEEAWWVCPQDQTALYRIGRGEANRTARTQAP